MRSRLFSLLTACLIGQAVLLRAEFKVPMLTGPVNDGADMLRGGAAGIDARLRKLWAGGGSQYAVLTVPNLGGETIEQASIKVVNEWKLGGRKNDNGVLIMLSRDERKVRIEVGQGLEGVLTDAYCGRVIRETMVPSLRLGDATGAVSAALDRLLARSDPEPGAAPISDNAPRDLSWPEKLGVSLLFIFFIVIFIVVKVFVALGGHPRLRGHRGRGGWGGGAGGGFGGGGSFGGGGFSGGGGGFSGGGSSGGW